MNIYYAGLAGRPFENWQDVKIATQQMLVHDEVHAPADWQTNKLAKQELQLADNLGIKTVYPLAATENETE